MRRLAWLEVLVLVVGACAGSDESSVTTPVEPSTTIVATTVKSEGTTTVQSEVPTTTATFAPGDEGGWQSIDLDRGLFGVGTAVGSVVFHPEDNSWVAVRSGTPANLLMPDPPRGVWCWDTGECEYSVLRSPDGFEWIPAVEFESGSFVADLVGVPGPLYPTLVAGGAVYDMSADPPRPVPAVWHLDVGNTGKVETVEGQYLGAVGGQIEALASMGPGYAAVGWICPNDNPECYGWGYAIDHHPAIWVSEDGYDWQLVPVEFGDRMGEVNDVVGSWADHPVWVSVGGDDSRGYAIQGFPGEEWTVVDLASQVNPAIEYQTEEGTAFLSGPCSTTGRSVAHGTGGFVAVGPCVPLEARQPYATSWVSPDGITWTQTSVANDLDLPAWMRTVTLSQDQYLAGGWLRGDGNDIPAIWASTDGLTWTRTELGPAGQIAVIAIDPGEAVIAAGTWDEALTWMTATSDD